MHLAALYFPTPKSDDARLAPAASSLTAIAVDKDKNSLHAVKWALEQRFIQTATVTLIHVRCRTSLNQGHATADTSPNNDSDMTQLFLPYKGLCARKRVAMKEVVLEDTNVAKAITEFINSNNILNIVVGASNRNAFTRKFRNPDLPSCLLKSVPEFCAVYVISKGRPVSVRSAKSAAPVSAVPPKQVLTPTNPQNTLDPHGSVRLAPARGGRRGLAPPSPLLDKRSFERTEYMKDMGIPKIATNNMVGNLDSSAWRRKSYGDFRDAFPDDLEYSGSIGSVSSTGSADFSESLDSSFSTDSSKSSNSPISAGPQNKDIDSEMKRLRLELKQTMDMYNTACKETVTANQKTREIHRWKMEESRKVDESRQAEETTLKIAEIKAKCKAANEAAEAAQRIAELEAKKRLTVELRAKCDAQGNKKASDSMAHSDIQYRKFTIDEIEVATEYFSDSKKIGEGGYGHVYKGSLDHTPVAIKVLRPDAAQGRQQFQQEIEVLSCIRHPNMVLLLGACPEYGCLVYEYMDNGSLEDRLNRRGNTPPIPWRARFQIAAEIATGLLFLHQNKPEPLVHRDLKPANILLDRNYRSKISDVGLARLVPPSVADSVTQYHMTSAAGTFCYIDPEYQQTGMLGVKSDIYSLGIMLLQIITAKAPMGLTHHVERAIERGTFADILDPAVKDWPIAEVLSYAKLALKCAELRKKDRPDLGTVILPELNRLSCLRQ